jgi:putative Mg2+ transporter-C (MgtC) family protein
MDLIADELFSVPGTTQTLVVVVRIVAAGLLAAVIGGEREAEGKAAGLRTHMLVALGAALFVIAPREAGLGGSEVSRIIQGVAAGIGFIGAGTILKLAERGEIKGLTTAASVWMTAAIGVAAGLGPLWVPVLCAACAWVILYVLARFENGRAPERP